MGLFYRNKPAVRLLISIKCYAVGVFIEASAVRREIIVPVSALLLFFVFVLIF